MYIIDNDQMDLLVNEIAKCQRKRDNRFDIRLSCIEYPTGGENRISIKPGVIGDAKFVMLNIMELDERNKTIEVILILDWTNPRSISTVLSNIRSFGINSAVYSLKYSLVEKCEKLTPASIFGSKSKCVIIDVEGDDTKTVSLEGIDEPKDIVNAFNSLQKRAIAIGFPIVNDTFTIKTPLELYYHEDYDCVLVDKSVVKDARLKLTDDDIAKLQEYEDNLKWKHPGNVTL